MPALGIPANDPLFIWRPSASCDKVRIKPRLDSQGRIDKGFFGRFIVRVPFKEIDKGVVGKFFWKFVRGRGQLFGSQEYPNSR